MYRRILIPVDEPSEVEPLVRFGAGLLDADGEIRVLHIIPTTSIPEVTREWRASVNIVVPAHEAGAALDVRVDPEVRASTDVTGEILESAESHAVDAILMTLRGDRRSRNPFVGHTASALLHHAPCDVLIVNRLALADETVHRIILPTFQPTPPPKVLAVGEELAVRHHGIPLIALQLGPLGPDATVPPPTRSARGIAIHFHPVAGRGSVHVSRRRLPETILAAAARERFGLLLVGEESVRPGVPLVTRRFLDELFRNAPCPVIAIHA
ncbi:MAG TPA: universal stress protein [Thermoplasmata archaeon]|nr:universal stress protein [Thermoplasmata archaeon]